MLRGGTSSPRLTASSGTTPGIGGRLPATACGAGRLAPITAQPTPPRSASASEREISQLCGRGQGPGKAGRLPRGKLTSLPSKVPRPMPPSGRSPPLAIPSGLPFMTGSSLACAKRERIRLRRPIGPWLLRSATGAEEASFDKPSEFAGALRKAMSEARDIELLFAIWEQNVETVRALNRSLKQEALPKSGIAPQLVSYLKQCAIAIGKPENRANGSNSPIVDRGKLFAPRSTRALLTFGELKRIRCKEHLRFVASQPCLICGRSPSHAHHVRYAQSKGLSFKVSDEFTVPLCAIHHHHIHTTGKEREWWLERNIDRSSCQSPLARRSRAVSRGGLQIRSVSYSTRSHTQRLSQSIEPTPHDSACHRNSYLLSRDGTGRARQVLTVAFVYCSRKFIRP